MNTYMHELIRILKAFFIEPGYLNQDMIELKQHFSSIIIPFMQNHLLHTLATLIFPRSSNNNFCALLSY